MAEHDDKESKSEEASENKVRSSVDKGDVPHSREVATFASMLAISLAVIFVLPRSVAHLQAALAVVFANPGGWPLENRVDALSLFEAIGRQAAYLLIPFALILMVAGLGASMLQNPPRLVFHRIQPDLSRLSLAKGWTRIFGVRGQIEFLRNVFKFGAISVIGAVLVETFRYDTINALFMQPGVIPGLIQSILTRFLVTVTLAMVLLAIADMVWVRVEWRNKLRMTRQEVKDEQKQTDGNPMMKVHMRSLARDRSRRRMIADVPRATFVVVNPTHYAVALRYVREETEAPIVIAKGRDLVALKIREIAKQHGIPIIEDKPLARLLYESAEVEKLIPQEFYKAVAEIILFFLTNHADQTVAPQRV